MLHLVSFLLSVPIAPTSPYPPFPNLQQDTWSEELQQYVDWIDTLNVLPKSLEYVEYLGIS